MTPIANDFRALVLHGDAPETVPPTDAPRTLITLPWRDAPVPDDPWLSHLLPRVAYNPTLLRRVEARPPPPGCGVALFLADPLINLERTFKRLHALGVGWIAAFPSVTRFDDEFARVLANAGLTGTVETAALDRARVSGLTVAAASWHADDPLPSGLACLIAPATRADGRTRAGPPAYIYPARSGASQRLELMRAPSGGA